MCEVDCDFTNDYEWTIDLPYGLRIQDLEAFGRFINETSYCKTKRTKTGKDEKKEESVKTLERKTTVGDNMSKLKNLVLPIIFATYTLLFVLQYFQGDSPSYSGSIKTLTYLIPFLFVWGGSHAPARRKVLLPISVLGIVLLQFPDLSIFLKKWYFTVPWIAHFILAFSLGYSDSDFLANNGRPKSVALNEASEKKAKGFLIYFSKPTMNTKKVSIIGYILGYIEKGFFGINYALACILLSLITTANTLHVLLWGSIYGFSFSVCGFFFHRHLAKPIIKIDKWGFWEMSAGICAMIGVALALGK